MKLKQYMLKRSLSTTKYRASSVKMVKFYRDIGRKDAEENAISEVIEYDNQRRSVGGLLVVSRFAPNGVGGGFDSYTS